MIMKYHSTVMLFPSLYLYQCVRPGAVNFLFKLVKQDFFWYNTELLYVKCVKKKNNI